MYVVGRPATFTFAAQLLFSLFITSNALPTIFHVPGQTTDFPVNATLGLDNETLIRLPNRIPWSADTSISQASVPYPIPESAITLNFIHFGFRIPVVRALSTIYDARRNVQSHLTSNSEDAAKTNFFEYSTRSTTPALRICSVVVQAYQGRELPWSQLDQVLEGLTQFSSGAGSDHQFHYQTLEYEVILAKKGRIGVGRLWCNRSQTRGAAEVEEEEEEEEAEPPLANQNLSKRANSVPNLPNSSSTTLSNLSTQLSHPTTEIPFPIPDTSLTLAIIWLGSPIPSFKINDAIHGAFLKIAPFLHPKPSRSSQPLPHNQFHYSTPAGGKLRTVIQVYGTVPLSWLQVDIVMAGLYRFTNGIGTAHEREYYRNLSFEVRDERGANIGFGNLLAVPD